MKRRIIFAALIFSCLAAFAQRNNIEEARNLHRQGNYDRAIAICEMELSRNRANLDAYSILCWSLIAQKQYEAARIRVLDALEIDRSDLRLIEIYGEALYYTGKHNEAMVQFKKYIASSTPTSPRLDTAYFFMGMIYMRQKKYQHADIALSAAVQIRPRDASFWINLGHARYEAGNYRESHEAYEEALKLQPNNTSALAGRNNAKEKLEQGL